MEITKMFQKDDVIIKEGEHGDSAYIIRKGSVGVYKSGKNVLLSTVKQGDVFGEMGLIEDRVRSASVIALEDTEVVEITRMAFNSLLKENPQLLLPLMRVLFDRLRQMDTLIAVYASQQAKTEQLTHRPVAILSGETKPAKKILQEKELVLTKFPFNIGRVSNEMTDEDDVFSVNDLYLPDHPPYNVSRNHCAISERDGQFLILDRRSQLGTILNDTIVGGVNSRLKIMPLDREVNRLVIGSNNSPYIFLLTLRQIKTEDN